MKLLFKRDEKGEGYPSTDQVDIGELVMNSVTGKLYMKLVNGTLIEFIGQPICFETIPDVSVNYNNNLVANDIINDFCCLGGILEFEVTKLKPEPYEYKFEFVELTSNTNIENIVVELPKYSDYTIPKPNNGTGTIAVRRAIIPINLAILNNEQDISIFKFTIKSISQNDKILLEKIITIKCQEIT